MLYSLFGIVPLAIIILVVYLIFRKRGNGGINWHHAYYYLVSFITLGILFWAVPDLIRLLLEKYVFIETTSSTYYSLSRSSSQNIFLKRISIRLSAIIVAFPVWGFHWMKANPPYPEKINQKSKKAYSLSVVIVTMIFMLIAWPYLLYTLISKFLGVSDSNINEILSFSIPYTFTATFLWLTHFKIWKGLTSPSNNKDKIDTKSPTISNNSYTSEG